MENQAEQWPEYLASLLGRDGMTGKSQVSNTRLTLAKRSYCYRGEQSGTRYQKISETLEKSANLKFSLENGYLVQGGIIKFASWELAAFLIYFARVSVNCGLSKPS